MSSPRYTEIEITLIKQLRSEGWPVKVIAHRLGRTPSSVYNTVARMKLPPRSDKISDKDLTLSIRIPGALVADLVRLAVPPFTWSRLARKILRDYVNARRAGIKD